MPTPRERLDEIYAVVCDLSNRHFPLTEISTQHIMPISDEDLSMQTVLSFDIDVANDLVKYQPKVLFNVVCCAENNSAKIKLETCFEVLNGAGISIASLHQHQQYHMIFNVETISLINFSTMVDAWIVTIGHMIHDAVQVIAAEQMDRVKHHYD